MICDIQVNSRRIYIMWYGEVDVNDMYRHSLCTCSPTNIRHTVVFSVSLGVREWSIESRRVNNK